MELPRQDMQLIEPRSMGYHSRDEVRTGFSGLDPFMNDGLPSFDIHQDHPLDNQQAPLASGHFRMVSGEEDEFDHSEFLDDLDQSLHESRPAYHLTPVQPAIERGTSSKPSQLQAELERPIKIPEFPKLITAAQLAEQRPDYQTTCAHPSCFQVGMAVEHDEYGDGVIVSLSGEGVKKMATIEFAGKGKKRFQLAFAKLRVSPPHKG
jgi:hypothetical protein